MIIPLQPVGNLRPILKGWQSGLYSTDELRDAMPWIWVAYGRGCDRGTALTLLRITGYATDAPWVAIPDRIRVYQGRVDDEPPGLAWSIYPWVAEAYAQHYTALWRKAGRDAQPRTYAATVRREDVLVFTWLMGEVVAETYTALRSPISARSRGPDWVEPPTDEEIVAGLRRLGLDCDF